MAADDAPPDDGERPWSPDDENLEREYLRELIKLLRRGMRREEEAERREKELERVAKKNLHETARGIARSVAARQPSNAPAATDEGCPLVSIRPIDNGFVVSFVEIVKDLPSEVLGVMPPGQIPEGHQIFIFRRVEAFIENAAAAVPYLERALRSLRSMVSKQE